MSAKNNASTIAEKTAKLNELVSWFDSDGFVLESALDQFTQAEALANEIEKDLLSLKNEITIVKQKFDEVE
jgi:exonuclease VII small subunit